MARLSTLLQQVATATGPTRELRTQELVRASTTYLLIHDPFYGRVLSQLRVQLRPLAAPLGLVPTAQDWQLGVDPAQLAAADWTGLQWLAMLRHQVLHLLWDHPDRYARALTVRGQGSLVRWATDAAVNDYLSDLPSAAITSRTLQALTGRPVSAQQDSAVYWQVLRTWQATSQTGHDLAGRGPGQTDDRATQQLARHTLDAHQAWQAGSMSESVLRDRWRATVLATTAESLSAKQRGTLPGAIRAALTVRAASHPVNWQGRLQRHLGTVPAGRQPAYGRFNRRQPQRMELPGQRSQTWQAIRVFIDQSGSMGNREISYLLGQLTGLLALYPAPITIYPFDTVVHDRAAYRFTGRVHDVTRIGGGGTRFQAIFDALPRLAAQPTGQLTVILTDGYGEPTVTSSVATDVIWLLTSPRTQFSLQSAPGTVISLATDPVLQAMKGISE